MRRRENLEGNPRLTGGTKGWEKGTQTRAPHPTSPKRVSPTALTLSASELQVHHLCKGDANTFLLGLCENGQQVHLSRTRLWGSRRDPQKR